MQALKLYLIGLLALPSIGWTDSGTTSANFLKLGIGPRAVAMGDAQVGLANDVYATYWNPAGLSQLRGQELGLVHTNYLQNINEQFVGYALPQGTLGTFGLSLTYLSAGSFQGYDAVGSPTTSVGASDLSAGLSYSRYLYSDPRTGAGLSAGITGKWIQERLDTVSAKAYAADLGLFFSPGLLWGETLDGLKTGITLRNVGSKLKFDQESFELPRVLTAGASYTGHLWDEGLTVAIDGRKPNDGPQSMGVGLELWTLQSLVARAGYTTEGDLGNGLRFGAGLRFKTIQVDYAFANQGDFGNTHRIGLTLKFSPRTRNRMNEAQRWYEKGLHDYKKDRWTEALVDFNKALEIDPSHPQALEMMKKTYEQLKEGTLLLDSK